MASGYTNKRTRLLRKFLPFLYKTGPCGNLHPLFDRYCYCRVNEYCGEWRGGVWDFRAKKEVSYEK